MVSPAVVWRSEYNVEWDAAAASLGRGCPKRGVEHEVRTGDSRARFETSISFLKLPGVRGGAFRGLCGVRRLDPAAQDGDRICWAGNNI